MDTNVLQNVVKQTNDYEQFTFLENNREAGRGHIGALIEAIQENPQLTLAQPILVNENMQIIDGQHRFLAIKELGMPVNYSVVPGLRIQDARQMNILHKGWGVEDYARSYALGGNPHYQQYLVLKEDYGFSHSVILMATYPAKPKGRFAEFRRGEYTIEDLESTKDRLNKLASVREITSHARNKAFGEAFMRIIGIEGLDFEKFLRKLEAHEGTLRVFSNPMDYVRALEDIYNYQVTPANRLRFY